MTYKTILLKTAYYDILGLPLIVWSGIFTLLFLLGAGLIGYLQYKGKIKFNGIGLHKRLAFIGLTLGIIHGITGILINI